MIGIKKIRRIWSGLVAALREILRTALAAGIVQRVSPLRQFAPYAALEILLPGGSLLALILWLVRRRLKKRLINAPCVPL